MPQEAPQLPIGDQKAKVLDAQNLVEYPMTHPLTFRDEI